VPQSSGLVALARRLAGAAARGVLPLPHVDRMFLS